MIGFRDTLDWGNTSVCLQKCFQRGLANGTVTREEKIHPKYGGTLKRANCPDDEGKYREGSPPASESLSAPSDTTHCCWCPLTSDWFFSSSILVHWILQLSRKLPNFSVVLRQLRRPWELHSLPLQCADGYWWTTQPLSNPINPLYNIYTYVHIYVSAHTCY